MAQFDLHQFTIVRVLQSILLFTQYNAFLVYFKQTEILINFRVIAYKFISLENLLEGFTAKSITWTTWIFLVQFASSHSNQKVMFLQQDVAMYFIPNVLLHGFNMEKLTAHNVERSAELMKISKLSFHTMKAKKIYLNLQPKMVIGMFMRELWICLKTKIQSLMMDGSQSIWLPKLVI